VFIIYLWFLFIRIKISTENMHSVSKNIKFNFFYLFLMIQYRISCIIYFLRNRRKTNSLFIHECRSKSYEDDY
jgi:hypothetical protein